MRITAILGLCIVGGCESLPTPTSLPIRMISAVNQQQERFAGQRVVLEGWAYENEPRRSGTADLWAHPGDAAHTWGGRVRTDACVGLEREPGTSNAVHLDSKARVTGILRVDKGRTRSPMDCPSDLVLMVEKAEPISGR
jgi:hypothetical protein